VPTRSEFGSTHRVNSRFRTVHVRISVPFPNAPILQSPRCPLDPSKAAAPSASNAALEASTHQKHKPAAALLLHQHALHSNPRETGMLAKLIAQPHDHRHPRSQSVSRKTNIMVPYRPKLPRHGHFGPIPRGRIAYTDGPIRTGLIRVSISSAADCL